MSSADDTRLTQRQEVVRGWRILVAAAFGAGTGAVPLAFYSFGAFIEPLSDAYGWTRAEIGAAPLFLTVGGLVAGVFAGAIADKVGARTVIVTSQIALVLAFAGMAFLPPSLPLFYAGYALIAILGAGTMTMTWTRTISGWFVRSRGLALGLSLIGTGTIGAFLPALVNYLNATYGLQGAYLGLAALPLIFGLPLTVLFFKDPPQDRATAVEIAQVTG